MDSNHLGGIDLHIHSTASDGIYTPHEIVQMAVKLGLQAIAITDHDTLDGSRDILKSPMPDGVEFLSGVEISAAPPQGYTMDGSLHILGYGVDTDDPALLSALEELQNARQMRNPQIIARLNQIGIAITMDEVHRQVGDATAGRPHIARALIEKGVVADINEAFDCYLSKGQPAYVDKYRIDIQRTLDLIHAAGGVSVLAHPYLVPEGGANRSADTLDGLIGQLREMGLMGIEAYYPNHTPEAVERYLDMARRYDLVVTGGTDFHGNQLPEIQLGRGRGDLVVPYTLFETLISMISKD